MRSHMKRLHGWDSSSNGGAAHSIESPVDSPTTAGRMINSPDRHSLPHTKILFHNSSGRDFKAAEHTRNSTAGNAEPNGWVTGWANGWAKGFPTLEPWLDARESVLMLIAGVLTIILCLVVTRLRYIVHAAIPLQAGPAMTRQQINDHVQANTTHTAIQFLKPQLAGAKRPWGPLLHPLVIAHRGDSADFPEHTREAYMQAIEEGADVIECDVVLTRDLMGVCRHEPNLADTTDALTKFPGRVRWAVIDGENVTGVFASDLTLQEVKTLRAVQPWPFRDQSWNGKLPVVTLEEYLDLALAAPRTVGVYPELKHPSWHNALPAVVKANTSMERLVLKVMEARGYQGPIHSAAWLKQPAYIQSFEVGTVRTLSQLTCLPLIQLLGSKLDDLQPDGRSVAQMLEPKSLQELAQLAVGVGPGKQLLVTWQEGEAGQGVYVSSGVVQQLHAVGLQVHAYTLRDEAQFVLPHVRPNVTRELEVLLVQLGVDGVFADEPNTTVSFIKARVTNHNTTLLNLQRPCTLQPGA